MSPAGEGRTRLAGRFQLARLVAPVVLGGAVLLAAGAAQAKSSKKDIMKWLDDAGFTTIEVSRSLFGNLIFEAHAPDGRIRKIVLGKDGTILREWEEDEDGGDHGDDKDDDHDDDD